VDSDQQFVNLELSLCEGPRLALARSIPYKKPSNLRKRFSICPFGFPAKLTGVDFTSSGNSDSSFAARQEAVHVQFKPNHAILGLMLVPRYSYADATIAHFNVNIARKGVLIAHLVGEVRLFTACFASQFPHQQPSNVAKRFSICLF